MAILSALALQTSHAALIPGDAAPEHESMAFQSKAFAIYGTPSLLQCCIAIVCALHSCFTRSASHCDDEVVGEPLCADYIGVMQYLTAVKRERVMAWKAPKIVEVAVGMEINMYACAARK